MTLLKKLHGMMFLNSNCFGVSYETMMSSNTLRRCPRRSIHHLGITDINHNVKNTCYHMVGGLWASVMGVYLIDPEILHLSGVSTGIWCTNDFSSDLLVLNIDSNVTIRKYQTGQ